MYSSITLNRINKTKVYLEQQGPIQVDNVQIAARQIGIRTPELIRILSIVRSPWWIENYGWTIPFVPKGVGPKTYSVEHTIGKTKRLRKGNAIKTNETETHLRRNLAGLELEARLATGNDQRKAQILAATTKAALSLIDLGSP